jgi:hypothetical protein
LKICRFCISVKVASPKSRTSILSSLRKTSLNFNSSYTIKPPKFYIGGCRILNIIHTRLRHRSSSLNADLFRVHLANDPGCIGGCAFEDATIVWFLFACLNLFRVGAFLNCGLNLFHDLIVEGKKEFVNNGNLVSGFLNSVWLHFNSFSSRI